MALEKNVVFLSVAQRINSLAMLGTINGQLVTFLYRKLHKLLSFLKNSKYKK
jgi:hypothetical protein